MGAKVALRDCGGTVELELPVGDARLEDLDVALRTTSLRVTDRRAKAGGVLLDVPQLFSTVDAGRSAWGVDGGVLRLELHKLQPDEAWPQLEPRDGPAPAPAEARPRSETENAMAARENVRQLFQAAVDGSVARIQQLAPAVSGEGLAQVKDATGNTALHYAALAGQTETAQYLLEREGIDVNALNEAGEPPLLGAAGAGKLETVQLLLERGAQPGLAAADEPQALHKAATSGNAGVVRALLAAGAEPDAASASGTPLMWACGSGDAEAVAALLAAGADANARTPDGVGAMLMAAAAGNAGIVAQLAAVGADPNVAAEGGATALHAAAEMGDLPTVEALLKAGADTDAEDASGQAAKPIHAAAAAGHTAVVERLLPLTQARPGEPWTAAALLSAGGTSGAAQQQQQALEQQARPPQQAGPADTERAAAAKRAGDEAFVARDFQASAASYQQSLDADVGNAVVWANLSAARLRLGQAADALSAARTARALDPKYMKAWFREAEAARALEQWEDAAQAYFEAFSLQPDNSELATRFQQAVAAGKAAHAAQQQQQQQAAGKA